MNTINLEEPTLLFDENDHRIFWLGIDEDTVFRCNTYLICDQKQSVIIDPGGRNSFDWVKQRVEQVLPAAEVSGLVLCHQDPDVAASMVQWLQVNPDIQIIASPRAKVLLPYFGAEEFRYFDVEAEPEFSMASSSLQFIPAPFLHSPMAIATFDQASGFLFTGDVFAAIDADWSLFVKDFEAHKNKMNLFHIEYMASNIATNGFVNAIDDLPITAMLPQHGSIIPQQFVADAKDYMRDLECGLDILYPELS